jgi:hypothetical protein
MERLRSEEITNNLALKQVPDLVKYLLRHRDTALRFVD